jgi:phage gp36-like protein
MGTYATTTSIPYLLVNFLKGNNTTTDTFGATLCAHHINNAEGAVNSHLGIRYQMPFSPVPPDVRRMAEQIACYNIIKSSTYQDVKAKNPYLDEFRGVFDQLKMYVNGELALTYTDGSLVPTLANNAVLSNTEGYTPIFARDEATKWDRDQNEIDDTEDSRG